MKNEKSQYCISVDKSDNPKLFARVLSNGKERLFLWYYFGSHKTTTETGEIKTTTKRATENLDLFLWSNPRTSDERRQNKEALEIAKRIRFERSELMKDTDGAETPRMRKTDDFIELYKDYARQYTQPVFRCTLARLEAYKEQRGIIGELRHNQINRDFCSGFAEYLKERATKYSGAAVYFGNFKRVCTYATETGYFRKNPCLGLSIKCDNATIKKSILSPNEISQIISAPTPPKCGEVKRAFVFCLFTGLRFCDVYGLTWGNVDKENGLLRFEQNKTKGRSSNSGVSIPLNSQLLEMIGEQTAEQTAESKIFNLPNRNNSVIQLGKIVEASGIKKHITWHCARHSFAVNVLNHGANIKTLSSLLGHSSIIITERYIRAVDELKRNAIDSLFSESTPKTTQKPPTTHEKGEKR